MIYGKTDSDKNKAEQSAILKMIYGIREFAWLPVSLHDGTKVWLEHYYAYYRGLLKEDDNLYLWSCSPDSFSPYFEASLKRDTNLINITFESREVTLARLGGPISEDLKEELLGVLNINSKG